MWFIKLDNPWSGVEHLLNPILPSQAACFLVMVPICWPDTGFPKNADSLLVTWILTVIFSIWENTAFSPVILYGGGYLSKNPLSAGVNQ